jgi:hypothetical protein
MAWLSNTSGKKDAILTLTVIGFLVVMVKLLLSGSTLILDGDTFKFNEIDASVIAAVLTPTLGAYVSRRYTDKKFDDEVEDEEE